MKPANFINYVQVKSMKQIDEMTIKQIQRRLPKILTYQGHKYQFCFIGFRFINQPQEVYIQCANTDNSTCILKPGIPAEFPGQFSIPPFYTPTEKTVLWGGEADSKENALKKALKWWRQFKEEHDGEEGFTYEYRR